MAYIHDLRQKVGHTPLIMTSASGALVEDGRILLQERADTGDWGFPGGYMEYGDTFKQTGRAGVFRGRWYRRDSGQVAGNPRRRLLHLPERGCGPTGQRFLPS